MFATVVNATAILDSPDRRLVVRDDGLVVQRYTPRPGYMVETTAAAWYRVAADWIGADRVNDCFQARGGFPAELAALIDGVLRHGCPADPLLDWLIEYAPVPLAREVELLQTSLLAPR